MTETTCPRCGESASGNFCAACGAAIGQRHCTECGAQGQPGARFCNVCGTPMAGNEAIPTGAATGGRGGAAAPRGSGGSSGAAGGTGPVGAQAARTGASTGESKVPWIVSGIMFVGLMVVLLYPILRQDEVAMPNAGGAAGTAAGPFGDASSVDLSTMTPRQQADALFERVMANAERGDSTQVAFFVPMAIQAYERAGPLDPDGLFHLSMLQQTADQLPTALETADQGLAAAENHILLLYAKGEAQALAGDTAGAEETFGLLLDVWDAQIATNNPDYEFHTNMLPSIEARAREITGR